MPHAFGHDERVAAENDRDVVMPAWKGTSLEVVETKLALEFLVGALGAPTFLDDPDDLLFAHAPWQCGEHELRRFVLPLGVDPTVVTPGASRWRDARVPQVVGSG